MAKRFAVYDVANKTHFVLQSEGPNVAQDVIFNVTSGIDTDRGRTVLTYDLHLPDGGEQLLEIKKGTFKIRRQYADETMRTLTEVFDAGVIKPGDNTVEFILQTEGKVEIFNPVLWYLAE